MMTYEEAKRLTYERMDDPQSGDRFHELYSYWVVVVFREGDRVVSRDTCGEAWRPIRLDSVDEFRARFRHGSMPGYWVLYRDREGFIGDVPTGPVERARWLDGLVEEKRDALQGISMESARL